MRKSRQELNPNFIQVFADDESASYSITSLVLEQGHTRVGFIKGIDSHGATGLRLAGFQRACREHGVSIDEELVVSGYFDFESGRLAARHLFGLAEPPSAIIASNDDMAAGVLFEARKRNIDVPDNVSVVGFDDTHLAQRIWPPLTTVRQPIHQMVKAAVDRLIKTVNGVSVDDGPTRFSCDVVVRQSTQGR